MTSTATKQSFTGASLALQEQLDTFRATHPVKKLTIHGVTWTIWLGGKAPRHWSC